MRIRQIGDPILQKISTAVSVEDISSASIINLVQKMKAILDGIKAISDENGNALSAPQVGQLRRLIVLRIDGEFCVMINPEFECLSNKTFVFDEECFSAYDLRASVTRYHDIEVRFQDEMGVTQSLALSGENAALVQHEVDHLDGVTFLDRVPETEVQSIEVVLSNSPARLAQVQRMMEYMVG